MSDSVRPHRQQPTRLPCPWDSPGKNAGVGCHFLLQCMKVKSESEVTQSCPTLCNPMDCFYILLTGISLFPFLLLLHLDCISLILLLQKAIIFTCSLSSSSNCLNYKLQNFYNTFLTTSILHLNKKRKRNQGKSGQTKRSSPKFSL